MKNEILTRQEAAARARISVRTMDALIAEQRGPVVTRIGRRVLVAGDDFDAWLVSRRQPADGAEGAA